MFPSFPVAALAGILSDAGDGSVTTLRELLLLSSLNQNAAKQSTKKRKEGMNARKYRLDQKR